MQIDTIGDASTFGFFLEPVNWSVGPLSWPRSSRRGLSSLRLQLRYLQKPGQRKSME
jgi:hypothetical protein